MRGAVAALLFSVALAWQSCAAPASFATAAPSPPSLAASVDLDKPTVATRIGQRFSFTSTVRNDGDRPMTGLIAHLNILSFDPGVYVDPEDWSAARTRYLGTLAAHASARVDWSLQAVNTGRFAVYVAVTEEQGPAEVSASGALRLTVAAARTVSAAGILPLAAGVPLVVLLLTSVIAQRRRRLR